METPQGAGDYLPLFLDLFDFFRSFISLSAVRTKTRISSKSFIVSIMYCTISTFLTSLSDIIIYPIGHKVNTFY